MMSNDESLKNDYLLHLRSEIFIDGFIKFTLKSQIEIEMLFCI